MRSPTPSTAPSTRPWLLRLFVVVASLGLNGACMAASDNEPQEGWRIMTERSLGNCIACHDLPGQTGVRSTFGPSLQGVGARYSAMQLQQWVVDARQRHPNTLMPPFGSTRGLNRVTGAEPLLSPEQIHLVVATLSQWQ